MSVTKKSVSRESFSLMLAMALIFSPSVALAVTVSADKTISTNTTDTQQDIDTDDVTLTNDAVLERTDAANTVRVNTQDWVTITNNSGASIIQSSGNTNAIAGITATNLTVNNSGTIENTTTNRAITFGAVLDN